MESTTTFPILDVRRMGKYTSIVLDAPKPAADALPGQFLHIRCEGFLLRRPISIAGADGAHLAIVFEAKGGGTQWLSRRSPGETLDVLGPLGRGFPADCGRVLLAGGGAGVPPLYFAAQRAEKTPDAVLAFRSRDRAVLTSEIAALCGTVCLMSDDGSLGTQGFAAQGIEMMLQRGRYDAVFACGPKIMLQTAAAVCASCGVPCWVSMEERMGCGVGACLTCAVPILDGNGARTMKKVCRDGPVFRSGEVIWDEQ